MGIGTGSDPAHEASTERPPDDPVVTDREPEHHSAQRHVHSV